MYLQVIRSVVSQGFGWRRSALRALRTLLSLLALAVGFGQAPVHAQVPPAPEGFIIATAGDDELQVLEQLTTYLADEQWPEAFRLLADLDNATLNANLATTTGSTLTIHALHKEINQALLSLKPEGRRKYRQYFDPQAKQQFEAVRTHPDPGSDRQLASLQELLDRFEAATIGANALELLGNLYFEQGMFRLAAEAWLRAIEHDAVALDRVPQLHVQRAVSMIRGGDQPGAQAIYQELAGRFERLPVRVGGAEVNGLELLSSIMNAPPRAIPDGGAHGAGPLALPATGQDLLWHLEYLDEQDLKRTRFGIATSNPNDLAKFVPEVVADEDSVYFAWLENAFAMDRRTGKLRWFSDRFEQRVRNYALLSLSESNPRQYAIALAGDTLLITAVSEADLRERTKNPPFSIIAIDKRTGKQLWQSHSRADWALPGGAGSQNSSVIGDIYVYEGAAYAVVHNFRANKCYLRHFHPATGKIAWTRFLGNCALLQFVNLWERGPNLKQEADIRGIRMPQPKLLADNGYLHVLIGEGSLITLEAATGQIRWGLQMGLPYLGPKIRNIFPMRTGNFIFSRDSKKPNPNGSEALLLHNGLLYVKQHMEGKLYAVDPATGSIERQVEGLPLEAKLIGVDDEQFYTMNRFVTSYKLDSGKGQKRWNNSKSSKLPQHAGAIYRDGRILILDGPRLQLLDVKDGRSIRTFEDTTHLEPLGGHVYQFDDLLVCVGETRISGYRLGASETPRPARAPAPQTDQADQSPQSPDLARLIKQLGEDTYARRQQASASLREAGLEAYDAVRKALDDNDAEIRWRAQRLLRDIEAQGAKAGEIEAIKSTRSSWLKFAELIGDTPESRAMFSKMHLEAEPLLRLFQDQPDLCSEYIRAMLPGEATGSIYGDNIQTAHVVYALLFVSVAGTVDADADFRIMQPVFYGRGKSRGIRKYDINNPAVTRLLTLWLKDQSRKGVELSRINTLVKAYQLKKEDVLPKP